MRKFGLYALISRAGRFNYAAKILSLAVLATASPLVALALAPASLRFIGLAAGLAVSAGLLLAIVRSLEPLTTAAEALRSHLAPGRPTDGGGPDSGTQFANDIKLIIERLEAVRNRLAQRHPVTGLPTREPLLAAVAQDLRQLSHPLVLGLIRFCDYERLAAFDQPGADQALRAFAARLASAVGPNRVVSHVEVNSFAVWFRGLSDPAQAAAELNAIGYVLSQELEGAGRPLAPSVAMGAAVAPIDGDDPAVLLTRALAAAPRSSEASAPKFAFYSAGASDAARDQFALEQALRQAVAREQLELDFQPVVDLAAGRLVGAEALLRWRHPERGLVTPAVFIPVAEQAGLMDELGLWVLNAACREVRGWEDRGLRGLRAAVNLSASQLRDPQLDDTVLKVLERHGLSPANLELELTETAAMHDGERTRRMFSELRRAGVGIALDDFGIGYSSLNYLKNFPFSKLKIDREFVSMVDRRRDSRAICMALIELSRGLGITVVGEGVERPEEVATLTALGCTVFQGYHISRPIPAADFVGKVTAPGWTNGLSGPGRRKAIA